MSYLTLGSRRVAAAADTSGLNAGQLTNSFTPGVFAQSMSWFEIYHAVIATAVAGQTFTPAPCTVYVNAQPYTFTFPVGGTEWDPSEAMLLRDGDQVDFCWALPTSTNPVPVVTVYLRYDPALPGNSG